MRTRASAELDAVRIELDLLVDRRGTWSLDDENRYLRLAEIEQLFLGGRDRDPASLTTSSG